MATQFVYHELKKSWEWGFKLEASYHFNTGNDLNVNWYHWKDTNSENIHSVDSNDPPNFFEEFKAPTITAKWDAVNFELGQYVDFGEFKNIRFHGGLQYARLQYREVNPFSGTFIFENEDEELETDTFSGVDRIDIKFSGIGPRIGADLSYDWVNGFALYANGATALLVGKHKLNDTSTSFPNRGSYTAVVPELEAKVGAKYSYAMAQGDLTLDAGYMLINYFNTFHVIQFPGEDTSFGLHGPYAGLKWVGNI